MFYAQACKGAMTCLRAYPHGHIKQAHPACVIMIAVPKPPPMFAPCLAKAQRPAYAGTVVTTSHKCQVFRGTKPTCMLCGANDWRFDCSKFSNSS